MKERRKGKRKSRILFVIYLAFSLCIIVTAYLRLSHIARTFNTEHLELITGLYAEKMNASMNYLQNYAQENVLMVQALGDSDPEDIFLCLEDNLDPLVFCNIGLILKNQEILGNTYAISDIRKKALDQQALAAETSFISVPYQSSETGNMIMTIFVPVTDSPTIQMLYMSIMVEDLRLLGVYELLKGKINVHLLKADSENFITCISSDSDTAGNWNNLLLQQKYFQYNDGYSYNQWIKDMRSGKTEGQFSAQIKGEDSTIAYRSISSMPGWYVIVELANKNISNLTQDFSIWGGIFGGILVGGTLLYMLSILLLEKQDKKRYIGLSSIDPLTELLNRRAFQKTLENEFYKKTPGIFIFIDIDNFKIYNDTYGHSSGDLCLCHVAKTMKTCFPERSILGRYGGDEFVVYLKHTSVESASAYMDEFQKQISNLELSDGTLVHVSVSAGGSVFPEQGEDYVSLCRSADVALYDVKQHEKGAFKIKQRS